ncbi:MULTISPECIES: hypothetical protein [Clostridia]|uniref:hypothetical protein n=1 Tax=Clostridia TaxID=186801 RepID=UPI000E508235|nr:MULTISPECIES: hypothetical protein [Clostridia]RHV70297.1 hypothetical protein DXB15_08325 [Roseburia sp. OM02-15]
MKKKISVKKFALLFIIVVIACVVGGILAGNRIRSGDRKNAQTAMKTPIQDVTVDDPSVKYTLNIDGRTYDITEDVTEFSTGKVMVNSDILHSVFGYAVTEEEDSIAYAYGTNRFVFYDDRTDYVFNDYVVTPSGDTTVKNGVYYIDLCSVLADLELKVMQSQDSITVTGY